jgi:hypothetical protein
MRLRGGLEDYKRNEKRWPPVSCRRRMWGRPAWKYNLFGIGAAVSYAHARWETYEQWKARKVREFFSLLPAEQAEVRLKVMCRKVEEGE